MFAFIFTAKMSISGEQPEYSKGAARNTCTYIYIYIYLEMCVYIHIYIYILGETTYNAEAKKSTDAGQGNQANTAWQLEPIHMVRRTKNGSSWDAVKRDHQPENGVPFAPRLHSGYVSHTFRRRFERGNHLRRKDLGRTF